MKLDRILRVTSIITFVVLFSFGAINKYENSTNETGKASAVSNTTGVSRTIMLTKVGDGNTYEVDLGDKQVFINKETGEEVNLDMTLLNLYKDKETGETYYLPDDENNLKLKGGV